MPPVKKVSNSVSNDARKSASKSVYGRDKPPIKVPIDGVICYNIEGSHVGNIGDIDNIKRYIKDNIIWYLKLKDYDKNDFFNENDEGLLKYIKLIIDDDNVNVKKEEINTLLTSILDAIQVDQAHDFLDGSSRSMSLDENGDPFNLSKCLGYSREINLHEKVKDILRVFENELLSNVKKIISDNDISDIKYSIRDTGVRDDFSKKIVSNTEQVVAIASIIDSAGCSQTNRNMPTGIGDNLELIITNIGYIFYQSFYKWFRMNNIVTLIIINNKTVANFINDCKKKYSIEFHISEKNVDSTSGISTQKYEKIYTQTDVIPGCNGDFTVNKIVNILYKKPNICCNLLYLALNTKFDDEKTKKIIMTYYVLNKGFGDFSQMFSCLYFNNREKYGTDNNIHYKNIILCTVDRFLAYISYLCKCPFILGASYTCRYYSCDTNSKYYGLNIIKAYNKFNNLKLIINFDDLSILSNINTCNKILSSDYKIKLINSKQCIISEYYQTHLIIFENKDNDLKLSSYKITQDNEGNKSIEICYSLKSNKNISSIDELNINIDINNFKKSKEKYDSLVNNDCKSIAESEIFSDFILKNYKEEKYMLNKVIKMYESYKLQFPEKQSRKISDNSEFMNYPERQSRKISDNSEFMNYHDKTGLMLGIGTILDNFVEKKRINVNIFNFFISFYEDIQNNIKLLENHLKKLYIIIDKNKELNEGSCNYINEIIIKLKQCLHIFISLIKMDYIDIFKINISSIIEIYTNNPYHDVNTIFEKILKAVGDINITEKYNAFILQYDTFKNIKSRIEKLNFDNALNNAKIAYHIAYGKLKLVDINNVKMYDVEKVVSIRNNVEKFILKLKNKKHGLDIDKKPNSTEDDIISKEHDIDKEVTSTEDAFDLDKELNYTEDEIIEINQYFEKNIEITENEEAVKEELEFIGNTGKFKYNCENNCEETNACSLSNDNKEDMEISEDVKDYTRGGNIKENKKLNRYNERIILIKYNIKELIKNNKNNNVEKMQKKIKDIKIKIKNIKEKEKKNKSKQPKPVKDTKDKKPKHVKDTKDKKPKPVKETNVKKQKPVKDTKDKKQKPVKEIKVKQPKPVKETKDKKPKPVKEIKVKQPKPVKETKDKKPKHVKETNVKQPKNLKETKVKQPKNLKDSKSKSPKPEKDSKSKSPKPEKEIKSKSQKPEKESKSKSPKPEKDTKYKSLKPEKESKSKSLKPEKDSKSKSSNTEKDSKSKSSNPEKDSKSKSSKL
jgi:hypothetical protein